MDMDNLDIKLVIQWDLPLSFNLIIQRMGRAGQGAVQSTFVFFIPEWSRIDDLEEIEKRSTKKEAENSQLLNSNRPRAQKPSSMSKFGAEEDVSDSESESDADLAEIFRVLPTEADLKRNKAKKDSKARRTNAEQRAKLSDEMFYYINIAQCRSLFALACHGDLTYADRDGSRKILSNNCCNGPGCLSPEPKFMHREPFIDVLVTKYQ